MRRGQWWHGQFGMHETSSSLKRLKLRRMLILRDQSRYWTSINAWLEAWHVGEHMCVLSAHLEAHCTLFFIFLFGLSSLVGYYACWAEPSVHFSLFSFSNILLSFPSIFFFFFLNCSIYFIFSFMRQ